MPYTELERQLADLQRRLDTQEAELGLLKRLLRSYRHERTGPSGIYDKVTVIGDPTEVLDREAAVGSLPASLLGNTSLGPRHVIANRDLLLYGSLKRNTDIPANVQLVFFNLEAYQAGLGGWYAFSCNAQTGDLDLIEPANSNTILRYDHATTELSVLDFFGFSRTTLTISGGVVTASRSAHILNPETGTTDDLDTISGGPSGPTFLLLRTLTGDTVTIKDGTGNLVLAGDFVMDSPYDRLLLTSDGSEWVEVCRSNNA